MTNIQKDNNILLSAEEKQTEKKKSLETSELIHKKHLRFQRKKEARSSNKALVKALFLAYSNTGDFKKETFSYEDRTYTLNSLPEEIKPEISYSFIAEVGKDFSRKVFTGSILENCIFYLCDFRGADFTKTKFKNCFFIGCDLTKAVFFNSNISFVDFQFSSLLRSNFNSACIHDTIFDDTSLKSAKFFLAVIVRSSFCSSNLSKADFKQSDIGKTFFECAKGNETCFKKANLWSVYFTSASFDFADFSSASFDSADFCGAEINQSLFDSAILKNCSLGNPSSSDESANPPGCFLGCYFRYATIVNSSFSQAVFRPGHNPYSENDFILASIINCDFSEAIIKEVNFTEASLIDVDFSKSDLSGSVFTFSSLKDCSFNFTSASESFSDDFDYGVDFYRAKLSNCDFSNSEIQEFTTNAIFLRPAALAQNTAELSVKATLAQPSKSIDKKSADQSEDLYFKSKAHRLIYILAELDGTARVDELESYSKISLSSFYSPRNFQKTNEWYHQLSNDLNCDHPKAENAFQELTRIYCNMTEPF